jgi:L-ascorbate metabolism protein UlaG (beta-lactamase superfamily)
MLERFTWYKQSGYLWRGDELALYIDPWEVSAEVPADVILITHAHFDHFSLDDIEKVRKPETKLFAPVDVASEITGEVTPVKPGERHEVGGLRFQTVPAYNVAEERLDFHPQRNRWVGYVIELDGRSYYHAGDTDQADELSSVRADVAFLPIGGTYTMDAHEAAVMAKALSPKLAVPMHYAHVVGEPHDAEVFKAEAAPVPVEILTPLVAFGD